MGNASVFAATCPFVDDALDIEDAVCDFDTKYEVDKTFTLGVGKYAKVYLCWRKGVPQCRYAVKVTSAQVDGRLTLGRTFDEIRMMRALGRHPSIVGLVDVDDSSVSEVKLVLELCEGGELYDRIQQKRFYPEAEGRVLVQRIARAVAYIHRCGIMHRDLKPENILLVSRLNDTDIKVSDFGLARMSVIQSALPRSRSVCGSDFYLAPEMIRQEEYGREIDVWAMGVITYVALSGSLPFFHQVLQKLYRQIIERDLAFPDQSWREVSTGAQDFILRLLMVDVCVRLSADEALKHPWLRNADQKL